ncbi:glycosyltransferase [Verrucomicrobiales bacterium]|nr:glycosyltransferase [Verrucomicrobiales bacterium]MDA7926703.1 glycosyltransferase [Verrucomicrobiales bacterium]
MKYPLVSVALPVKNVSGTFQEALESIQSQTIDDIEIIIVDHGSTDGTGELIKQAAKVDSRIHHYAGNGTFVEAANLAWQKAKGQLVARMDGDDVAYPDRLAKQIAFLDHNPDLAACGTLVRIVKRSMDRSVIPPDEGYQRYNEWINSVKSPEAILRERFIDSPIPNPTAMIRREVLIKSGGYSDPIWAEDYDFWLRLLEMGYGIGKVDEVLLDWYDSDQRSTRTLARYELSQFQNAKAHYVSQIKRVKELGVIICGAGPIGKEFSHLMLAHEIEVHAFIEVNERKLGNRIHGIPVLGLDSLPSLTRKAVALSAIGQAGARDKIRADLIPAGFKEGVDFFCVA